MNLQSLKRGFAATSLGLAAAGLIMSFSFTTSANAIDGSNSTGSAVGTVPQCAWHLEGVSGVVTLANADSSKKYNGAAFAISGSTSEVKTYVADQAASAITTDENGCSWYNSKKGASVTVSTTGTPAFTSTSFGAEDTSMNFTLDGTDNKLTATVTPTCTSPWTTPSAGENDIYVGHVSGPATALAKGSTSTISSCTYQVTYATAVPAGKQPLNAGQNYAMTGPSLTTTLTLTD